MHEGRMVIVRPPSEATSFLLPVTLGCSNNSCTFCNTYNSMPFRIRELAAVKADIDDAADHFPMSVERVFLENGDALVAPQRLLVPLLEHLYARFPKLERVGTYSTPRAALMKSPEQLRELSGLGLKIAYLGVESGDEQILKDVCKGAIYEEIVEAGCKLKAAGITLSVTYILGLGGAGRSRQNALGTARILTDIDPDYAGALALILKPRMPLYDDWQAGRFELISPMQSLEELRLIIEKARFTDCFFTANHASNYLPMKLWLPRQRGEALRMLGEVIAENDESWLRPDSMRRL